MTTKTAIPAEARFGLSRSEASEYVGVSTGLFDELVKSGLMPPAKMMKGRRVWLRPALERAAYDLPDAVGEGMNSYAGGPESWLRPD